MIEFRLPEHLCVGRTRETHEDSEFIPAEEAHDVLRNDLDALQMRFRARYVEPLAV